METTEETVGQAIAHFKSSSLSCHLLVVKTPHQSLVCLELYYFVQILHK